MNAQNNDSFLGEATPSLPEMPKTPDITTKEHKSALGILSGFWHKKGIEKLTEQEIPPPPTPTPEVSPVLVSNPDVVVKTENQLPASETPHVSITEKISHIFHKKSPLQVDNKRVEVAEKIDPPPLLEVQNPETPLVIDERFANLLKQDTTYHSMIRSEDLKNIQLQLSMRYMLLMLAIFVVIAWVVNNRVIMFGFSDFPFLARTRDGLFALLTGLFSLTVWFGAAVWFRHRVVVMVLRILGGMLFLTVLVSIYLPFWR